MVSHATLDGHVVQQKRKKHPYQYELFYAFLPYSFSSSGEIIRLISSSVLSSFLRQNSTNSLASLTVSERLSILISLASKALTISFNRCMAASEVVYSVLFMFYSSCYIDFSRNQILIGK